MQLHKLHTKKQRYTSHIGNFNNIHIFNTNIEQDKDCIYLHGKGKSCSCNALILLLLIKRSSKSGGGSKKIKHVLT